MNLKYFDFLINKIFFYLLIQLNWLIVLNYCVYLFVFVLFFGIFYNIVDLDILFQDELVVFMYYNIDYFFICDL